AFAQAPVIGACTVLPADNIWNTPVDQFPVSGNSSAWVNTIGATKTAHADLGSGLYNGAPIGIPYVTVPGTQTKYPASFTYADESDPGPYATPLNAPIEGGSQSTGDRHVLSVDTDHCILYELYSAYPQAASWTAGAGSIFNLLSNALRPSGWTSTDAAGLPIFPGLFRYDEIAAGEIRHALRFTVPQTQRAFVWPARHYASSLTGTQYPPMGARFRLRAGFDISGFSAANQVILRALKKYGMMLADNGSAWYLSGAPDPRWDNSDLHNLGLLKGSDFEAVDVSGLMIDPNSGQAKQSTTVSVTVSPSSATVQVNTTKQFTASVANATTQTVNWSVNSAPGGNSTVGLVNTTGLYTAPAVPPAGGTVSVQAASTVSPSAIGTATVTITTPAAVPVLSSITPNSGTQGTSVSVTLAGSNFKAGATVAIGGTGVSATNFAVVSATQINATFVIAASASTGAHSVTVTTSGGTSSAQSFTAKAPVVAKPTLSSLTPNAAGRGATVTVTLSGTNFVAPATVAVQGSAITVSNVVVVNSTTITATFRVGSGAGRRSRDTSVTTSAGTSNSLPFTVQ
ncbi:MAG: putative outerrane protein (modular protein), partial [Candidatus Solibacter sp.]|nr:putative outerrane protein (modular protein) [Candidatus Solibacter sp.]